MLLDVPDAGNVILSGDAIYMRENIEKDLAPGICWNGDLAVRSIRKLVSLSKLMDAHIIVSHDLEYWKTLPLSPKKYTR
jgi:N-acyl homoserine lactone hydrolase